jgi:hypothetical protein
MLRPQAESGANLRRMVNICHLCLFGHRSTPRLVTGFSNNPRPPERWPPGTDFATDPKIYRMRRRAADLVVKTTVFATDKQCAFSVSFRSRLH